MRRWLATILLAGALNCAPVFVAAQTVASAPPVPQGVSAVPFRVLDQDRLFRESRIGQRIRAGIDDARQALEAENQTLFDQLAAEERALTDARPGLEPDAFRARADAFDARVEAIRAERAQRSQDLNRQSEAAAQSFFNAALPVLVQLMNDEGVLGLLKPEMLVLGSDWLDITDTAIARLDAATPDDVAAPAPTPPETPLAPVQQP